FIDEGQRPNVAPVEVPRSTGKGRRRPTVDESPPTPLSKQRSDTILAIGLDDDAPVPRSRPTPPRPLDQSEESLEGPALLEAPLNRRSDSPVETREVDPPTVAPQEGPPLPPPMPSKVERRPQPQAFVAPPLIPTAARPPAEPDDASKSKAEVVKLPPKGQGRRKAEPTPVELSADDFSPIQPDPTPVPVTPVPVVESAPPPVPRRNGNNAVRVGIAVLAGIAVAFFGLWITSPNERPPKAPAAPVAPAEVTPPPAEVLPPPAEILPPPVETPPVEPPTDAGVEALPVEALGDPPPGVKPEVVAQTPVPAPQASQPTKNPDKGPRTPKSTPPKVTPPVEEPKAMVVVPATPEPPAPTSGAVKLSVSGAGADRVDRVLLVKGGQRWDLRSAPVVPVGSYPVTVFFKGQSDTSGAGVIQVSGDTTVSLRCSAPEGGDNAAPDCSASAARD
ncbi:hypothetical protein L6R49_13115, partial [Myxococcota bacterium]|nr:hypothetical protein [Myxococcota bacterium]